MHSFLFPVFCRFLCVSAVFGTVLVKRSEFSAYPSGGLKLLLRHMPVHFTVIFGDQISSNNSVALCNACIHCNLQLQIFNFIFCFFFIFSVLLLPIAK